MYKTDGRHIVADFWGCPKKLLTDNNKILNILKKTAEAAGATIIAEKNFKFKPFGLTAVVLLQESHISCHTYPEYDFMALDIYTCGKHTNPQKGLAYLKKQLKPKKVNFWSIKRG